MFTATLPIVLASASPRRRELLASLGFAFTTLSPAVDETERPGEPPLAYSQRITTEKALAGLQQDKQASGCIIAADTIVTIDGAILQKPLTSAEARTMLTVLQGRMHEVVSSYAIATTGRDPEVKTVRTSVVFRALSSTEISAYLQTGEYRDKAGAYAIQGFGASLVREISGSYTNVVGLPLAELTEDLLRMGVISSNA